jgi:YD repeat-containing protein
MGRPKTAVRGLTVVAVVVAMLLLAGPAGAATWHIESLDGPGSGAPAGGRVNDNVGQNNGTTLYGGQPHTFYYDGFAGSLRHEWWDGGAWHFETLDGPGSPYPGTTGHIVGFDANPAIVFGSQLHVFYRDSTALTLRHAWYTPGAGWAFEVLDGAGGIAAGAVTDAVGAFASVVDYGGAAHVFYWDPMVSSLRHAWWTGTAWNAETLDGSGTTRPGSTPHTVGSYATVLLFGGQPHVFYRDITTNSQRHAWWTGAAWAFDWVDGTSSPYAGHTPDNVGFYASTTLFAGTPHLFSQDVTTQRLRHVWWTGAAWAYEDLDGNGTTVNGHTTNVVGSYASVVVYAGGAHVFSYDSGAQRLRHAWWNGTAWTDETIDGQFSPYPGATNNGVGSYTTVLLFGGQPHVFYYGPQDLQQRHAWYG